MSHRRFSAHRNAVAEGRFLRVVNYHNTPASARTALTRELASYASRFVSVGLQELDEFFAGGTWRSKQPGFIPVFYEGYRNSAEVAGPVCDELGLSAWFPICTAFIDTPSAEQEAFARSHSIDLVAEDLDRPDKRIAMSWDEIVQLSQRHVVTPHTASHVGLADVCTDEDFEREVAAPKRRMDAMTGRLSPAFAWLHGTQWGASERHDRALQAAGYRYLFSNTGIHRIA